VRLSTLSGIKLYAQNGYLKRRNKEAGLLGDFLEKNLKVEINKEFCDTYLKEFKDLKVPVTFYLKDKL